MSTHRKTAKLYVHQRHTNRVIATERRLEIAALTGRLRSTAREVSDDPDFVAPGGLPRHVFVAGLRGTAKKIESRRDLGLSLDYWITSAQRMLGE